TPTPIAGGQAWLMMSDVCKHCKNASCMEVCPTNALMRTEYDTVYIQNDVCNGCRNCISACPYGVIGFNEEKGIAQKCTLCYDRPGYVGGVATAVVGLIAGLLAFRSGRMNANNNTTTTPR